VATSSELFDWQVSTELLAAAFLGAIKLKLSYKKYLTTKTATYALFPETLEMFW